MPIGCVEDLDSPASELGCNTGNLPTTYLGLPLEMRRNSASIWDRVEERFRRKLTNWKRQYISEGGRLTLSKNTISNLSIYIMSLSRLPKESKIGWRKFRDFFGMEAPLTRSSIW